MWLEPYTQFLGLDALELHVPIKITENEDSRDLHRSRGLLSRKAVWLSVLWRRKTVVLR